MAGRSSRSRRRGWTGSRCRASAAAAVLDFDGDDGGLDIVVSYNNDRARLYRNTARRGNWLGFDLEARHGNRDALGARVTVEAPGVSLSKEISPARATRPRAIRGSTSASARPRRQFGSRFAGLPGRPRKRWDWPPGDTIAGSRARLRGRWRHLPARPSRRRAQERGMKQGARDEGRYAAAARPLYVPGDDASGFKLDDRVHAHGRPARGHRGAGRGPRAGGAHQVLLGVTGSGKTFTMANVIERLNRPTLVIAHNKTLAAQLYQEFRRFFPDNAVEYFVSYYDYYQPEAYVPRDRHLHREGSDDQRRDRPHAPLGHARRCSSAATCIIVASVSCIYGLGSPEAYHGMLLLLERGRAHRPRRRCCASWSRSSTRATTSTSSAARSACAATWSRSSPRYEERGRAHRAVRATRSSDSA